MRIPGLRWLQSCLSLAVLTFAPGVMACNTPVYRYALEHWEPQPYEVLIFRARDSNSTEAYNNLIRKLTNSSANVFVTEVDADSNISGELAALRPTDSKATLPWAVLRFPGQNGKAQVVAAASFNDEFVEQLLQSPARKKIARHLGDGGAAVWLLVDSGQKGVDENQAAVLEKTVARLSDETKAAASEMLQDRGEAADSGPYDLHSPGGAKPVSSGDSAIACIHVRRNDPAESILLKMLFESNADFARRADGRAAAFLIFGRGRILTALSGDDLTEDEFQTATDFLSGPCLCSIKEQNPGTALLIDADWDQLMSTPASTNGSSAPGLAPDSFTAAEQPMTLTQEPPPAAAVRCEVTPDVVAPQETALPLGTERGVPLLIAGLLIGLGAATVFVWSAGRRSSP